MVTFFLDEGGGRRTLLTILACDAIASSSVRSGPIKPSYRSSDLSERSRRNRFFFFCSNIFPVRQIHVFSTRRNYEKKYILVEQRTRRNSKVNDSIRISTSASTKMNFLKFVRVEIRVSSTGIIKKKKKKKEKKIKYFFALTRPRPNRKLISSQLARLNRTTDDFI